MISTFTIYSNKSILFVALNLFVLYLEIGQFRLDQMFHKKSKDQQH